MRRLLVNSNISAHTSHRGRLEIIAHILSSANGGEKKTSIMYKCNLSFKQLEIYLSYLLNRGLLKSLSERKNKNSKFYEITEKGLDFLRAYHNLAALIVA